MIKAYAYQEDWGRCVRLIVGYTEPRSGGEAFWPYDFATATLKDPQELNAAQQVTGGYSIPLEYAEEMYHALDRVFGKRDETPGIVKDVLAKEQGRVDLLINALIEP